MTELHVVRVFRGPDGGFGNELGVVLDGGAVPVAERQGVAAGLGFAETVFVDDVERAAVDIRTPSVRLPFAGHPLVGVSWLLRSRGHDVGTLHPSVGPVPTWADGDLTWIRGRAEWVPGREMRELPSPAAVDALPGPPPGSTWLYVWAWQDRAAGRVRTRGFPRRGDAIVEDEATGASAIVLAAHLGRPLTITQGRGSQLFTRPGPDGTVELAGRVVLDHTRPLRVTPP